MKSDDVEKTPLAEEVALVAKKEVVSGHASVRTVSEAVEQTFREQLESQTVEVTRVPVAQEIASAPSMRTVDGVMIVPMLEERLIVVKKHFSIEEIHIRTTSQTENVEVPVTVRK